MTFTMCLQQHLSQTDATYQIIRSHSARSLFSISGNSYRCFNQISWNKLIMFSPMKRQHSAYSSNLVRNAKNINQLEVEIISTENIKPATPTPKHLRTYELSILDQFVPPTYIAFVYFYSNNNQNESKMIDVDDLTPRRRQILKRSLSKTLTRFYPLAGKIKDNRHIDCNDDGVYCVEAKVNQCLSDFLSQPDNKCVQQLLPFDLNPMELFSKTHVLMIQLTTFTCGGISIGLCASHKIFDGSSYATFFKAWAATAAVKELSSQFISPSVFTTAPAIPESMQFINFVSGVAKTGKTTTKRFVFRASSLEQLKKKGGTSRILAVNGLIWKCAIKALKARTTPTNEKSLALTIAVNLRGRSSPPISSYSIGNFITLRRAVSQYSDDDDIGLESLVTQLKNSIDEVDGNYVEALKGKNGLPKVQEMLNVIQMYYSDENSEHQFTSSFCNNGMYETDFGWGKPLWISYGLADDVDPNIPRLTNLVLLMDTRAGNGIEAWVTLLSEDMAIFERDTEMLEMALVDPSPFLQ